jgi:hypothetical protein
MGVAYAKKKWEASIRLDGADVLLGKFDYEEAAARK